MFANSRFVQSRQEENHPDLKKVLSRHFASTFLQPLRASSLAAFSGAISAWEFWSAQNVRQQDKNQRGANTRRSPLILDAGCGTGWSSICLARQYPESFVLGVDQSAHRLERGKSISPEKWPTNLLFVRADLVDFWRLLGEEKITLERHFLFYPNPWPKIGHLKRRWHGHPVFPALLQLGGILECRSNWKIYIDELAWALSWAGHEALTRVITPEGEGFTPFERKYHATGQTLWGVSSCLDAKISHCSV